MKKSTIRILSLLIAVCLCLSMASCEENPCPHDFVNDCDTDCGMCGYDRTICHVIKKGDCNNPDMCVNCGETYGEAYGHNVDFTAARSAEPQVCDRCHLFVYPDNHTEPFHN